LVGSGPDVGRHDTPCGYGTAGSGSSRLRDVGTLYYFSLQEVIMKGPTIKHVLVYSLAAPAMVMLAGTAQSTPIQGSSAYAFQSTVPGFDTGLLAATSNDGSSDYNQHNSDNDKVLLNGGFDSDVLESRIEGDGNGTVEARSHTDDIEMESSNESYKLSSDDVKVSIGNDKSPSAYLEDIKLTINGTEYAQDEHNRNPAANTSLADFLGIGQGLLDSEGISGTANEQGDGYVNAL